MLLVFAFVLFLSPQTQAQATGTIDISLFQNHPPFPFVVLARPNTTPIVSVWPSLSQNFTRGKFEKRAVFVARFLRNGSPASLFFGCYGTYCRSRDPKEYGRQFSGDSLIMLGYPGNPGYNAATLTALDALNVAARVFFHTLESTTELPLVKDALGRPGYRLPLQLGPGQYSLTAWTSDLNPPEPAIFFVAGQRLPAQPIALVGSDSACMKFGEGNAGIARIRISGEPLPCPLKTRLPTLPSAAWTPKFGVWSSQDFYFQAVTPTTALGVRRPTYTPAGDLTVANEHVYYHSQSIGGNRQALRQGPRGVGSNFPTFVDMHISPISQFEGKSFGGNYYAIATCGSLVRIDGKTGDLQLLAGLERKDDVTVDHTRETFKGTFVGGYKQLWKEPWSLAFDMDSLAVRPVTGYWHGGVHPGKLIALVTDPFMGDIDCVVWSGKVTGPSDAPMIYRALHFDNDQPWFVRWHAHSKRWLATLRRSSRVISFTLDANFKAVDIQDFIQPARTSPPRTWKDRVTTRFGKNTTAEIDGYFATYFDGKSVVHPEGIAVDTVTGRVFVASHTMRTIFEVMPDKAVKPLHRLSTNSMHSEFASVWLIPRVWGLGERAFTMADWQRNYAPFVITEDSVNHRFFRPPMNNYVSGIGPGRYFSGVNYGMLLIFGPNGEMLQHGADGLFRGTKETAEDVAYWTRERVISFNKGKYMYSRGDSGVDSGLIRPSLSDIGGTFGVNPWGNPHFLGGGQMDIVPADVRNSPHFKTYLHGLMYDADMKEVVAAASKAGFSTAHYTEFGFGDSIQSPETLADTLVAPVSVSARASTLRAGTGTTTSDNNTTWIIVGAVLGGLVLVAAIIVGVVLYKRHQSSGSLHDTAYVPLLKE